MLTSNFLLLFAVVGVQKHLYSLKKMFGKIRASKTEKLIVHTVKHS